MFTNWAIDRGPHFVYFWGPLVQSPLDQNMAAAKRPSDPHLAAMILISLITSSIRSWPQQSLNHWTKKTLYKPPRYTECVSVYGIYLYVFDYLLNLLYCACVSLSIYIYIAWGMYLFPTCRPLCIHPLHVVWGVYSWQIRHNWSVWRCGSWIKQECVHHLWCILCKSENM